jgi:hypothetical protein
MLGRQALLLLEQLCQLKKSLYVYSPHISLFPPQKDTLLYHTLGKRAFYLSQFLNVLPQKCFLLPCVLLVTPSGVCLELVNTVPLTGCCPACVGAGDMSSAPLCPYSSSLNDTGTTWLGLWNNRRGLQCRRENVLQL